MERYTQFEPLNDAAREVDIYPSPPFVGPPDLRIIDLVRRRIEEYHRSVDDDFWGEVFASVAARAQ